MPPPGGYNFLFSINGNSNCLETELFFCYNRTFYTFWEAITSGNETGQPLIHPNFYVWNFERQSYVLSTKMDPHVGYWAILYAYPLKIYSPLGGRCINTAEDTGIF